MALQRFPGLQRETSMKIERLPEPASQLEAQLGTKSGVKGLCSGSGSE
jgi:hypothetical protein